MRVNLLDTAPDRVEVKDGNIYYHFPDSDEVFGQPIHAALRTSALVHDAVRRWRASEAGRVVCLKSVDQTDH